MVACTILLKCFLYFIPTKAQRIKFYKCNANLSVIIHYLLNLLQIKNPFAPWQVFLLTGVIFVHPHHYINKCKRRQRYENLYYTYCIRKLH